MTNHINSAIHAIRAMPGPGEGELRVALNTKGNNDFWGHFAPEEAIEIIRANPRLEFLVAEKWYLSAD